MWAAGKSMIGNSGIFELYMLLLLVLGKICLLHLLYADMLAHDTGAIYYKKDEPIIVCSSVPCKRAV